MTHTVATQYNQATKTQDVLYILGDAVKYTASFTDCHTFLNSVLDWTRDGKFTYEWAW